MARAGHFPKVPLPPDDDATSSPPHTPPMIRDCDETGGRPIPYEEVRNQQVLDEADAEITAYNDSYAMKLLRGVIDSFNLGDIAAGVRKAKELATWLEGQPMWMYAGIMAELLHKVARHAPPAIGRSLARRALLIAPRVGIWAPAGTLIYFSAAIIHRRLGNVLKVRAYCRELLRLCPQEGSRNFWYLPYYFQSELLGLEGKDSEALPLAEKSLALIKQYGAFDVRLGLQAMLYCAQVNESSGHLKAARQYYREYLDAKCYQWLKPAVSIKQAWDGFHRTKEPARPKF